MSSENTPILITGATGYIGGAILARLLTHPSANTFEITALIRNAEKAKILNTKFPVKTVVGSHSELDKVRELVKEAHVVFHTADADDEPLARTILEAMRERHSKLGDLPILIHTSGTGVLTDDARGEYATETIYDDLDVEQIKSIPPSALHHNVDLMIVDADVKGYARTQIVLPSTIYGLATHALVEAGVSNPGSQQIPGLIKASLARKRAGVIGKGKALWPDVHIDDIAELYIVLFDSIVAKPEETGHGWEGFYFGENGEHSWYQIGKTIGDNLVQLGMSTDAEPTSFTVEELPKYFGSESVGWYFGTNSRCKASRARSIGWKPKYTAEDMLKSITPEIQAIIKQQK